MSHPALLLKRHLANIYARVDEIVPGLADFMERITDEIDNLEREKLPVKEFREFVDEFNKALSEGLPSLEEEAAAPTPTSTEANTPTQKAPLESNVDSKEGTVAILDQKSNETLQNEKAHETQDMPQEIATAECTSFPMKVSGDVFYVGDGVTSVVGDAEIPSGTTVDATLVVKGNFKVGENCRLLKDVKALKDIAIGANTTVEGSLVAGGKITLGSSCVVHGSIESDGDIEIDENSVVEGTLRSKSSIVLNPCAKVLQTVYAVKGVSTLKATSNV
jgi:cytoskeletal protein CcmA (bactofilin family)